VPAADDTDARKAAFDPRSDDNLSTGVSDGHLPPSPCASPRGRPDDNWSAAPDQTPMAANLEIVLGNTARDRGGHAAARAQGLLITSLGVVTG
jgi:hypothetical protein